MDDDHLFNPITPTFNLDSSVLPDENINVIFDKHQSDQQMSDFRLAVQISEETAQNQGVMNLRKMDDFISNFLSEEVKPSTSSTEPEQKEEPKSNQVCFV